jgi:site-specific DNA-methyltransferase (adenine-specific)
MGQWNYEPMNQSSQSPLPAPVFHDAKRGIKIYQGDSLALLPLMPENSVDLVFADPPYFLSNDGITCHAGRMVSVNKGAWDRRRRRPGRAGLDV